MLPEGNYVFEYPSVYEYTVRDLDLVGGIKRLGLRLFRFTIAGDPPPEAWNRVHRYAGWMHRLFVEKSPVNGEATSRKVRLNSPASGLFPALQELTWVITRIPPSARPRPIILFDEDHHPLVMV